jgi:hypothetical protein
MYHDTFSDSDGAQARVEMAPIRLIRPSPENDLVYKPVEVNNAVFQRFAAGIEADGILNPLVVSRDYYIISGHRRHAAAVHVGLEDVPVIVADVNRGDGERASSKFIQLLTKHNDQRVKSIGEQLRESVVTASPADAYRSLVTYRRDKAKVKVKALKIVGKTERTELTAAKVPFFNAVVKVLNERKQFWPLSDRQIHYVLLNNPPLIHASKPGSRYRNDKESYHALLLLLSSARVLGRIPWNVIADPTRPVIHYEGWPEPGAFLKEQLDDVILRGYFRNLLQSQPNHFELLGEKNTVEPVMRQIASFYTMPLTICRGYPSLPPRHDIAERFKASGKAKLVLLVASDFDPEGEDIPHSVARSLRDDFGVKSIHAVKVALTARQVKRFKLKPNCEAKKNSTRFSRFAKEHGTSVFELEALDPLQLDGVIRDGIDAVMDRELFQAELAAEREDAARIETIRGQLQAAMREIDLA